MVCNIIQNRKHTITRFPSSPLKSNVQIAVVMTMNLRRMLCAPVRIHSRLNAKRIYLECQELTESPWGSMASPGGHMPRDSDQTDRCTGPAGDMHRTQLLHPWAPGPEAASAPQRHPPHQKRAPCRACFFMFLSPQSLPGDLWGLSLVSISLLGSAWEGQCQNMEIPFTKGKHSTQIEWKDKNPLWHPLRLHFAGKLLLDQLIAWGWSCGTALG